MSRSDVGGAIETDLVAVDNSDTEDSSQQSEYRWHRGAACLPREFVRHDRHLFSTGEDNLKVGNLTGTEDYSWWGKALEKSRPSCSPCFTKSFVAECGK